MGHLPRSFLSEEGQQIRKASAEIKRAARQARNLSTLPLPVEEQRRISMQNRDQELKTRADNKAAAFELVSSLRLAKEKKKRKYKIKTKTKPWNRHDQFHCRSVS